VTPTHSLTQILNPGCQIVCSLSHAGLLSHCSAAIPGDASSDVVESRQLASGDVLVGASTVVQMAKFASKGEFENYTDKEIPFDDIDKAIESIAVLITQIPEVTMINAQKERCRRQLNKAKDYEEMRDVANSPVCLLEGTTKITNTYK
jgi:hypothetical protein